MPVYAATIFLSAFLLFQIQPLIAKFILPWFGGSAAVWSASLLFFQLLLLGGYFYAHLLVRYLKPRQQFITHSVLLAISLATLPVIPSSPVTMARGVFPQGDPTAVIFLVLGGSIGLPYLLLSATSPLLQAWYVRIHQSAVPYRLFALSNFGSMIALISYPTWMEPNLPLRRQAVIWSWIFAAFALACMFTAWKSRKAGPAIQHAVEEEATKAPGWGSILLWIGFSACASVLLLAVTSHLTQNVAPIPLLWVLPLSLYLLSFIFCFESDRFYPRSFFLPLLAGALGLFTYGIALYEGNVDIKQLIGALCGALFVCCMVCHGELARLRPHPKYLTHFYLMVSVGGAIGGLFVALVSPRIFKDYWELPVAMVIVAMLVTLALWRERGSTQVSSAAWAGIVLALLTVAGAAHRVYVTDKNKWPLPAAMLAGALLLSAAYYKRPLSGALALATLAFAAYLGSAEVKKERMYVRSARNFYGVMHVRDDPDNEYGVPAQRVLVHGTIDHGTQLTYDKKGRIPTSYFGYTSGINRAIRTLHDRGAIRLGILGLGAGVTATLSNAGDTLHYYEINPLVLEIASVQFGFLKGTPAKKQVFMGDARLLLEDRPSDQLDFLAMDAFTSDAVPMHLLTKEAFEIYRRHLKPDGVLAVHISNRYLDLAPVVAAGMQQLGWRGRIIDDDGLGQTYYTGTTWTILARDDTFFKHVNFNSESSSFVKELKPKPGFMGWTDDFSNIVSIIK